MARLFCRLALFMARLISSVFPSSRTSVPTRIALWLLDSPRLGHTRRVKRIAGSLLRQPALKGCVQAQSRLGRLLCHDCKGPRDRRIGQELLRQAARAGDSEAQRELELLLS
ncbi:hypothetical protein NCCP436_06570 [Pseudomonas sp. NCCP-436]|nr:hypothetical protein NCCP436_06570 [Pseudomonas sp. NCCP-436]